MAHDEERRPGKTDIYRTDRRREGKRKATHTIMRFNNVMGEQGLRKMMKIQIS